jgi:conjugal transfer/entry exclusion protein
MAEIQNQVQAPQAQAQQIDQLANRVAECCGQIMQQTQDSEIQELAREAQACSNKIQSMC